MDVEMNAAIGRQRGDAPHLGCSGLIGGMQVELTDGAIGRAVEPRLDVGEDVLVPVPVKVIGERAIGPERRAESPCL